MRWLGSAIEETPGFEPLHVATLTSFADLFEGGSRLFDPALYESFSKFKNSGGQVTYQTFNNAFSRIPMDDSDGTNVLHLQQTLYLDVSCIPS